jgi:hypothetical protein
MATFASVASALDGVVTVSSSPALNVTEAPLVVEKVNTPEVEIATEPTDEPFFDIVNVAVDAGFVPHFPAAPFQFAWNVIGFANVNIPTI